MIETEGKILNAGLNVDGPSGVESSDRRTFIPCG